MPSLWVFLVVMVMGAGHLVAQETSTDSAEACRVYTIGKKELGLPYMSPTVTLPSNRPLALTFFINETEGRPKSIQVNLKDELNSTACVFINVESEVLFRKNDKQVGELLKLSSTQDSHLWVTLSLSRHGPSLILQRPESHDEALEADVGLSGAITAAVSSNLKRQSFVFDCAAGCMVHDHLSPLIGKQMSKLNKSPSSLYFAVTPEGEQNASFVLHITKEKPGSGTPKEVDVELSRTSNTTIDGASFIWRHASLKLETDHLKTNLIVRVGEEEKTKMEVKMGEHVVYSVQEANGILWTHHCYPEVESDLTTSKPPILIPDPTDVVNTTSGSDKMDVGPKDKSENQTKKGAGLGEVLAWVLAGLALFTVMILALTLCTKMRPHSVSANGDYLPSCGVISQNPQIIFSDIKREPDEESEPDSSTHCGAPLMLLPPSSTGKVPEEDDCSTKMFEEDEYSSKVLEDDCYSTKML